MENALSPEEKLFKLIKQNAAPEKNGAAAATVPPVSPTDNLKLKQSPDLPSAVPEQGAAKPLSPEVPSAVSSVPPIGNASPKPASSPPLSFLGYFKNILQRLTARYAACGQHLAVFRRIEVINRSLAMVLIALLAGFVYVAFLGRPSLEKNTQNLVRPPARVPKSANQEAFMSPEEYVKISRQRNIFSIDQNATVAKVGTVDKPDVRQTRSDLQLVGIYFSEEPEVIIEDKVERKTYFLKEGQNIKEIKVKTIRKDRVILESDGIDWELM